MVDQKDEKTAADFMDDMIAEEEATLDRVYDRDPRDVTQADREAAWMVLRAQRARFMTSQEAAKHKRKGNE